MKRGFLANFMSTIWETVYKIDLITFFRCPHSGVHYKADEVTQKKDFANAVTKDKQKR